MSKTKNAERCQAAHDFRVPRHISVDAIYQFLSSLDTPRALTVWLLFSNNEQSAGHDQLSALGISPEHYVDNHLFRLDYTATTFLSKASFLKTSFDRKVTALQKFEKFESLCGQTNKRFLSLHSDPQFSGPNVWLLNATRRKIESILEDFSGDEFVDEANWGPGVSTLLNGCEVSGYNKFRDERGITRDLYSLVRDWFPVAYPCWSDHLTRESGDDWADLQVGNKIVTVPKNSKTDRVIAIEPGINLWFQKAIGSMIRRRLRRFGIDLNDQSVNQDLARSSSRDGLLATVDFSSASDSISLEVVRDLLPPRWFQILDACRSKVGFRDDQTLVQWNKFSSMGNGFTFELESLIFFAAACAVRDYQSEEGVISVYGDDVILPSACFDLFSSFSAFLGFRVNTEKSFFSGKFRESCGAHYIEGIDCKPIFLKERLSNVESIYKLANSVRLLAHRHNSNYGCDKRFFHLWHLLINVVPEQLKFRVPVGAGDVGFVSDFDEACPSRARYGLEGFFYESLVSVGKTRRGDGQGLTLSKLRVLGKSRDYTSIDSVMSTRSETIRSLSRHRPIARTILLSRLNEPLSGLLSTNERYTLRGRTQRRVALTIVAQWYNFGCWD